MDRNRRIAPAAAAILAAVLLWACLPVGDNTQLYSEASEIDRLPSYWFAGDIGKLPLVKNQGAYGTCWAITASLALESALLPQEHIVFSADHISLQNSFETDVNDGGDYLMLMAYLCGWQGPVTEEEDPYGDNYSPDGLTPAVHVQEMRLWMDARTDQIKEAVRSWGAVQTSLYMDQETAEAGAGFYNPKTCGYYYPEKMTQNHDILILGWDDSYSAENFIQTPAHDGAFICMNTWGSEFGEDGIFYVSYDDPNLFATAIAYTRVEGTDNYDRLYQYDDCGWQGKQGYNSGECWFSCVYTAEADETLSAVGFYATGENAACDLYLIHDFDGTDSFEQMEFLQSAVFSELGYYTVDLDSPVQLREGERFAVAVKIDAPGETNPVAVEYRSDEYTQNVTTQGKESYISRYGINWENTQEKFDTNVCLKVYTRE